MEVKLSSVHNMISCCVALQCLLILRQPIGAELKGQTQLS